MDVSYMENDPVRIMFTNERFQDFLKPTVNMVAHKGASDKSIDSQISHFAEKNGVDELLRRIDFLVGNDGKTVNRHHELFELLQMPRFYELVTDDVALEVLLIHIRKVYLPCLPIDSLTHLSLFDESEVEEAVEFLKEYRFIRGSMIMEGMAERENVVRDADDVLTRLNSVLDMLDDVDGDMVSVDDVRSVVETESPSSDSDYVFCMTEDEFESTVRTAMANGIDSVRPAGATTFDVGEAGTKIKKDNEWVKEFVRLSSTAMQECGWIQENLD